MNLDQTETEYSTWQIALLSFDFITIETRMHTSLHAQI